MIYLANERKVINIDGLGTWPRAASIDYFRREHGGKMPPGILRTVMPAAPAAWIKALERYGTMWFGEVAQRSDPSHARRLRMHGFMAEYIRDHEDVPALAVERGSVPAERPAARRSASFRAEGARRDAAVHGGRGSAHAARAAQPGSRRRATRSTRRHRAEDRAVHQENGGWVTLEDLAAYEVRFEPPSRPIPRHRAHACGPWSRDRCCRRRSSARGLRSEGDGPQLGRIHPPPHRSAEARVRRPPSLLRRPEVRRCAAATC